jgi:hypothetical protein
MKPPDEQENDQQRLAKLFREACPEVEIGIEMGFSRTPDEGVGGRVLAAIVLLSEVARALRRSPSAEIHRLIRYMYMYWTQSPPARQFSRF